MIHQYLIVLFRVTVTALIMLRPVEYPDAGRITHCICNLLCHFRSHVRIAASGYQLNRHRALLQDSGLPFELNVGSIQRLFTFPESRFEIQLDVPCGQPAEEPVRDDEPGELVHEVPNEAHRCIGAVSKH